MVIKPVSFVILSSAAALYSPSDGNYLSLLRPHSQIPSLLQWISSHMPEPALLKSYLVCQTRR